MATNYARASYQEVIDLSTKSGSVSLIGIHTPNTSKPIQMLRGFWTQFRKFKYSGCKVTLIPSATLPADPLQVSYEAGEPTIDPRDMLNPIMFHGCHGESIGRALNVAFSNNANFQAGDSLTEQSIAISNDSTQPAETQMYYSALSDPTWKKFGVQTGAKLPFMSPRVWKTATAHPIVPGFDQPFDSNNNSEHLAENGALGSYSLLGKINAQLKALGQSGLDGSIHDGMFFDPALEYNLTGGSISNTFMSSGTTSLGWLPTHGIPAVKANGAVGSTGNDAFVSVPKIFMGILMMPPSYKQELYYRMVITHSFEFKDFTTSLTTAPNGRTLASAYDPDFISDTNAASEVSSSIESDSAVATLATEGVF